MIKETKIKIKISNKTLKYFNLKGYECKSKDLIEIKIEDLPKQSTVKITAICDICGAEKQIEYRKYINNISNKNYFTCSEKCSYTKTKLTKIENHGVENFNNIEKRNETCIKKYGDKNFKNKEKQQETNQKIYGFKTATENIKVKEKIIETYKRKYGVSHPMKNVKIIQKKLDSSYLNGIYNNNIEKTLTTIKSKLIENMINNFNVDVIDYRNQLYFINCRKGHTYESRFDLIYHRNLQHTEQCTICNPISVQSSGLELMLLDFIKNNYDGNIIEHNRKIITPYELDIFLPDLNLAFEFNGLYWHNEENKDKKYHQEKYLLCKEKNIQLIQIWEDDWIYKNEIIKSMILNKLNLITNKIPARKCIVKEVNDNNILKRFLNENHIQGYVISSIKLGLFHNDDLISLMTFKQSSEQIYELNRFCNKLNTIVNGAASKLFKHFLKTYNYKKIVSFSNNSYSNGHLYNLLGFKEDFKLPPDYSYIYNNKRIHKFNFRKTNLKKYDIEFLDTERNTLKSNKIYRIYDAGKIKFIYP